VTTGEYQNIFVHFVHVFKRTNDKLNMSGKVYSKLKKVLLKKSSK